VETTEVIVWSAMMGGLLTLVALALSDALINQSVSSWRGLIFIVLTGGSAIVMSGLPEILFPGIPVLALQILKSSLGPLSGALALSYLGMWLGVAAEDRIVRYSVVWGSAILVLATVFLILVSLMFPYSDGMEMISVTAPINAIAVVLAALASVRAAILGDRLARWMVLACAFLAVMVGGLFWHDLLVSSFGIGVWIFTAICTVAFFLVVTSLSIQRSRMNRQLERLAGISGGSDAATGLPQGSILLSKVDDAFWRSARMQRECTVVCLHLRNLYELGEDAGHNVDQQILSAMAARMRRAVGFRNVVGLYHPRCFVVVISAVKQPHSAERMVERLRFLMSKPMNVVGLDYAYHIFTPRFGLGIVKVTASSADPSAVIDEAERLALMSNLGSDNHPAVPDAQAAPETQAP
jgi:GGDEF domain-containing protein